MLQIFKKNLILNNPNADLFNDNVYTTFVYILSIHSQDIKQNEILRLIKGCYSVVYLRKKMTLYGPNADLLDAYV